MCQDKPKRYSKYLEIYTPEMWDADFGRKESSVTTVKPPAIRKLPKRDEEEDNVP